MKKPRKSDGGRCMRPACKSRRDSETQLLNAMSELLGRVRYLENENEGLRMALNWKVKQQVVN